MGSEMCIRDRSMMVTLRSTALNVVGGGGEPRGRVTLETLTQFMDTGESGPAAQERVGEPEPAPAEPEPRP